MASCSFVMDESCHLPMFKVFFLHCLDFLLLVCFGLGFSYGRLASRVFCLFLLESITLEQIGHFGAGGRGLGGKQG